MHDIYLYTLWKDSKSTIYDLIEFLIIYKEDNTVIPGTLIQNRT